MPSPEPLVCPDCGSPFAGVQYRGTPEDYDGVSEWVCTKEGCGARFGRWTGTRLHGDSLEPRYGAARRRG